MESSFVPPFSCADNHMFLRQYDSCSCGISSDLQVFTHKVKIFQLITQDSTFRFRYKHDSKVPGLSSNARQMRKHRNIVTMKFNMFNWILETLINILILSGSNRIFTILYILVMSSGTPLVYFMGIEENRKQAKEHFKSNIKIFKSKKIKPK